MTSLQTAIATDRRLERIEKELGIILLEGEPTIEGQLIARKQALKHCLDPRTKHEQDPGMLQAWIDDHLEVIEQLEALK